MAVSSGRVNTNQISHTTFYVKWSQVSQSIANNETTINWEAGLNNGNMIDTILMQLKYIVYILMVC